MSNMKALVFIEKDRIELEDKPIPDVGQNADTISSLPAAGDRAANGG